MGSVQSRRSKTVGACAEAGDQAGAGFQGLVVPSASPETETSLSVLPKTTRGYGNDLPTGTRGYRPEP